MLPATDDLSSERRLDTPATLRSATSTNLPVSNSSSGGASSARSGDVPAIYKQTNNDTCRKNRLCDRIGYPKPIPYPFEE